MNGDLAGHDPGVINPIQQTAKRADITISGKLERQSVIVRRPSGEKSGGGLEVPGVAEIERDVTTRDAALQFVRGALGDQASVVEHSDAVSKLVGFVKVLGREERQWSPSQPARG